MVISPHPLAAALIERLHACSGVRVLDFASGSGRNTAALRAAGFSVVTVDDAGAAEVKALQEMSDQFDAVVSTHGLLHGMPGAIASRLQAIAQCLCSSGLLYASFGSTRDARFGEGRRLGDWAFAPLDGDERDVAHTYYDRDRLGAMLAQYFEIESLDETGVDEVAGRWAHATKPLHGAVHWFTIARKR